MAVEFVSELSDKLGKNNTAANLPKHIKVISAPNYQRTDNGVVTNPSLQTALDGKAATAHASTATTYGVGSSTKYGHVKLYDNVTGSNTDGAPTQKAVKDAFDAAATKTELSTGLAGKAASTHSHGNITSDGKVGTTANKPLITTTGGAVTTGAFGTSSGQFAEGNHKHSASDITSGTLGVARGGTGITSNPSMLTNLGSDTAASVFAASPRPGITGTLSVTHGGTGRASVAANRFLVGNGSTALVEKTPEQVADLIGADVPPKRKYFVCANNPPDGDIYYYKLATIRCSREYLDHPFTFEVLTRFRNPFIINLLLYGTNNKTPGVRHFDHVRSIKDAKSRSDIKVGYTLATVDNVYEYTIWVSPGSWGTIASVLDTEPEFADLVTFHNNESSATEPEGFVAANDVYLPRISTLGKGSSSKPIYVDTNGEIQEIGYTIEKSVPSNAVFTDTTYTANNGVSLSGTTFSNSGVRSATINGDYLRVNTNGTNADLTIPYATNAHRLRAAYAEFKNTTGYRLLAEIHPITGTSENTIATFDAFFTSTNNNYSLAHIYVNIRTNHDNTGTDTYQYYWGYIDKNPAYSGTQIRAYTKTGSNSVFLFAYVSAASWCGVQLSINQTSDYNGHYRVMDIVDLKHDDTLVASLDSSYTQLNATKSYHNVLAATSQVGSSSVPVYIKSDGTVNTCSLGTAALKDVPASGNASSSQVVLGNDTRLSFENNTKYNITNSTSSNVTYKIASVSISSSSTSELSPGVLFLISTRDGSDDNNVFLANIRKDTYEDASQFIGIITKVGGKQTSNPRMNFYVNTVNTTTGDFYIKLGGYSKISVLPLTYAFADSTTMVMTSASLPSGATEITPNRFVTAPFGGAVAVGDGGTGKTSVTANSYLKGNGTGALVARTYAEVRSDLGISSGANKVEASTTNGKIKIDGTETTVYTHPSHTAQSAKGSATKVPQITTDSTGHVTGITEVTITGVTPASHTHGNITNGGALQTTDVTIASGDKIVVTDSSNSNKLARTSLSFDGTTTSQALTKKGTFETFAKITWMDSIPSQPIAGMIYAI